MAGYGDDTAFAAWLAENGHALPGDAPAPAILRQRGSAYLDALYGAEFSGKPTAGFDQERAWPRIGAETRGASIPNDIIPGAIVRASYVAAWHEANYPGSLNVSASAAGVVKREKVGPIETEYFEGSGDATADATVRMSSIEGVIASFLRQPDIAVFVV